MPETFGKYELVQKIAQGGMAEIFLARRQGELGGFEKQVAIKRIFRHLTGREETVNMFFDEARIAATLNHPNIVQVYDLGEVDGYFYIAMEFVHGTDVRRVCKRGLERDNYLPIEVAAHIVAKTAGGLHYAHTRTDEEGKPRNIVHRDISPQNILLSMDGHVKICDFGIAKAENRLARTRTGQFKGKLSYMSPEQFNGEDVDARSDVFNLGIVLYEITLARRLFDAKTDFERMRQIANAHVTPPSEVQGDYPPGLERIILKALRHDPTERYQTAEAVQLELEDWLHEQGAKVGSVQVGDYMEQIYPELREGVPENMAQVEFPADGRAEQGGDAGAVRERAPGLHERSSPEESTDEVRPDQLSDSGPESAETTGSLGSESSESYGSVTVDPSKQPNRSESAADSDELEDPTKQVQVDREEIRRAAGEGGGPESADTQVTRGPDAPTANREAAGPNATTETDRPAIQSDEPGEAGPREDLEADVPTEPRDRQRLEQGPPEERSGPPGSQPAGRSGGPGPRGRGGRDPGRGRRERDSQPLKGGSSGPPRREHRSPPASAEPHSGAPSGGASGGPPQHQDEAMPGGPPGSTGTRRGGGGTSPPGSASSDPAGGEFGAPGEGGGTTDHGGGGDEDLEPQSALQRTWQTSVDIVTNGEEGLSNRRQRLIAYAVLGAGVIGAAIYVYTALMHRPELSDMEKKMAKRKRVEAQAADAATGEDRGPTIPTVMAKLKTKPKGATVLVNGAPVPDVTPVEVPLAKEKNNELYIMKFGHVPRRVHLAPGESSLKTYELKKVEPSEESEEDGKTGPVQVRSDPKGATVFVDGKRIGKTPTKTKGVPRKGRHYVRLEKKGHHSFFGIFEMQQKGKTGVYAKLANSQGPEDDDYCEVVWDIVPQGATVKVNGTIQGNSSIAVRHTCGEYLHMTAWKKDYKDGQHFVHLRRPGKYLMRTALEKVVRGKGKIEVDAPDDIRVFIGAQEYGKGSIEDLELSAGEYRAVFVPGGSSQRYEKSLKVVPDETTTYRFRIDGGSATLERVEK